MVKKALATRKHLRTEHVIVNFTGHAGMIKIKRPKLKELKDYPPEKDGFVPKRLVINLKLLHTAQPKAKIVKLDPPVEVRVRYTKADFADKDGHIRMAYWDGKKWIRFMQDEHQFSQEKWNKAKDKGWVSVFLKQWGDPPIAVGT